MNNIKCFIPEIKLTNTEKHLVKYINENPEFFISHKINEIAQNSNTSTACITRISKKLGFNSFKEFQMKISNNLNYIKENINLKKDNDLESTINNLKYFYLYSLKETLENINQKELSNLIEKIIKSKKIILYGVGSSFLACNELAVNLEKIGFNTITNKDFHHILLQLPTLNKNDLVIIISKSGYTSEVTFLIEKLNELKIEIAFITTRRDIKNKVNYLINFKTYEQEKRITAISSKIAQLVIVDLIFTKVFNKNKIINQNNVNNATNIINQWNKK